MKSMYGQLFAATTHDVIRECMRAYLQFIDDLDTTKLTDALRPLVSEDFVFVTPFAEYRSVDRFIATFAKWAPVVDNSESAFWEDANARMFGGIAHLTLPGKTSPLTTCDFYWLDDDHKIMRIEMVTSVSNYEESADEIRAIFG